MVFLPPRRATRRGTIAARFSHVVSREVLTCQITRFLAAKFIFISVQAAPVRGARPFSKGKGCAEDWCLELRDKKRRGDLLNERTFLIHLENSGFCAVGSR